MNNVLSGDTCVLMFMFSMFKDMRWYSTKDSYRILNFFNHWESKIEFVDNLHLGEDKDELETTFMSCLSRTFQCATWKA